MRDERVRVRRSTLRRLDDHNRHPTGRRIISSRRRWLSNLGIQARAKEPEMNRVSECKEKRESEVKKAAVGSIWTCGFFHFMITSKDGQYVRLEDGRYESYAFDFANSSSHKKIFCVTIERDPDEQ